MWKSINKYVADFCKEYKERSAFHGISYGEFYQMILQLEEESVKKDKKILPFVAKPTPHFLASFLGALFAGKTPVLYENEEALMLDRENLSLYEKQKKEQGLILFSSGTTGIKKAVDLPMKAVFSMFETKCISMQEKQKFDGEHLRNEQFRVSIILPLHHLFGLTSALSHLGAGDYIILHGNAKVIAEEVQRIEPDTIETVPSIVSFFYKKAKRCEKQGQADLSSVFGKNLKYIITGGAALKEQIRSFFIEHGYQVFTGYGLTEIGTTATVNGKLYRNCECMIYEEEVFIRSDEMMHGYLGHSKENRIPFVWMDGKKWFPTGDLGKLIEGELQLTGRKKNLIIRSNGENVSPEELEQRFLESTFVDEVLVYQEEERLTAEIYGKSFLSMAEEEKQAQSKLLLNDFNKSVRSEWHISTIIIRQEPFAKTSTLKLVRNRQEEAYE